MPAAYAHYYFGKKVYKTLPKQEQEIIREGKYAFLLGLHGPDLLFYYFPVCKNRINQEGVKLHKSIAADFFEYGVKQYQKNPDPILRAYLYGYLCHFMLDSECHPYIDLYMEEKDLGHLEIETDFDRYLMEKDGKNPLFYVPIRHLFSLRDTCREISRMYDGVSPVQIHICIRLFRQTLRLFVCRNKLKRKLMRFLFHVIGQDKELGGLIMDGRKNPACRESNVFLKERMEHTVRPAAEEIVHYGQVLDGKGFLSMRLYRNYEEAI